MRITELEVNEVRGLRHLILRPTGKNLVICGPNGSGKSGIVDAIDFLLTGRIQRLTGKGTKDLSLKKHGVHIGAKASETTVRAVITVPGHSKAIEISRSMAQPDILACKDEDRTHISGLLDLAGRGQHVLSRREILKFITSEAGDRAQEIQAILNLSDIEAVRQSLKRTHNDLKRSDEEAQRDVQRCEANLAVAAQIAKFDARAVLAIVNAQRVSLAGGPLTGDTLRNLKAGLAAPRPAERQPFNTALASTDLLNLTRLYDGPELTARRDASARLLTEVQTLLDDTARLKEADRIRLFELGNELLDETGACPLCDAEWPKGVLAEQFAGKIARASEAAKSITVIKQLATPLLSTCRSVAAQVTRFAGAAAAVQDAACEALLREWMQDLTALEEMLRDPLANREATQLDWRDLARFHLPPDAIQSLEAFCAAAGAAVPRTSPQQTAWDLLTRVEEHAKLYESARSKAVDAKAAHLRASELYQAFESARDRVLRALYDAIKDRFVELYRDIHFADESTFEAAIRPDGAGLAFEVDFYGTGAHPPHALHSEGHQDSMGLCLYLALAEYLNKGTIDLIVLDDVVMSVDAGHRRHVSRMLSKHFGGHQFLITTHERAWAGQLKAEGVVTSPNTVSFYDWTLQGGPCVDQSGGDLWKTVRSDITKGDMSRAAATLRYGMESFFRQVCGALRAPIPYNLQERWDFGEYLSSSVPRLKKYIVEAAQAAKSWDRDEQAAELDGQASILMQTFARSQAEQWAINPNVHYNNWANFTKQDFEPVVDAMEELQRQFLCSTCGTCIEAQGVGLDTRTVSCSCGTFTLNLQRRPKPASAVVAAGPVRLQTA